MQLSEHFSLDELTFSQAALRKGIDNTPSADQVEYLKKLCSNLLEPVRTLLGIPVHVDSGFRCKQVNMLVGSTAPHSAHLDGRAADIVPIGRPLQECFLAIKASDIPFDQMIIECGAWLHLAIPADGTPNRRMMMTATGYPGQWTYTYV